MLNSAPQVIEGQYFKDLMAQPHALQATHAWLGSNGRWHAARSLVSRQNWARIVLTGMGSSFHTLHPLNLALIDAGLNPVMMETSELIHYGMPLCDARTIIVAVSQSGGSAETVRLLDLNKHSTLLAVTNTADSPLARRADLALLTQAGPEFSVSCKTYVAGLLALQWLAAVFTGGDEAKTRVQLEPAAGLVERYLQSWRMSTEILAAKLRGIRHLFLTGRGASLAAVGTGALIIKESTRVHAEGMSSAAFRHGPMEMLQKDMLVLVFGGSAPTYELNHRLAAELIATGGHCEEIGVDAAVQPLRLPQDNPVLLPILEILPVQMMTLALAGLAGREAGFFERASKITDTE